MYKYILALALGMITFTCMAQVAVIDTQIASQNSPISDELQSKAQAEFNPRKDAIVEKQKEKKEAYDALEKNRSIMTVEQVKDAESNVIKLNSEEMKMVEDFQTDFKEFEMTMNQKILEQISAIVQNIAEELKLDLVVIKQVSLYSKDSIDITEKVVSRLKELKS